MFVMDIFGFYEQSLQGADIIAFSDEKNQYRVFVPDWFDGKPADISWWVDCLAFGSSAAPGGI